MVATGLDTLLTDKLDLISGKRVGVVTNHSAITHDFRHIADALISKKVEVTALFGPEHGVRGDVADGQEVASGVDARTGVPAFSLYGATKKPTPEMMTNVDILILDVQDVGARFYTFVYTMAYCLQACAEQGKTLIVLDRPNPINGVTFEGPILDPEFSSFVGMYPIPTRHGLTMGELARYFNSEFEINAPLEVVPCEGWRRDTWFDQTGLPWVMPSPNMPTLATATAYTGFCDFEGTNMSEGRGTSRPFEIFGAPFIGAYRYADELNRADLPGVVFRATYFIPTQSKHAGVSCGGVQAHVTDRNAFRPVFAGLKAVEIAHRLYPDEFRFREPGPSGKSFFDLLLGSNQPRLAINAGKSAEEIAADWPQGLMEYGRKREQYLLY